MFSIVLLCTQQTLRAQTQDSLRLSAEQKRYNQKLNKRYIISFPEGFSLDLPLYTYFIDKGEDKYSFRFRDDSEKKTDIEILITDYDLQDQLKDQHYYALGKNSKFMLYGYYEMNMKTKSPELRAYRLFSTIVTNDGKYVTVISPMFESMDDMNYYTQDVSSLRKADQSSNKKAYSYERYNSDMSGSEKRKYDHLFAQIKAEMDRPSAEKVVADEQPIAFTNIKEEKKEQPQVAIEKIEKIEKPIGNTTNKLPSKNTVNEKKTSSASKTKQIVVSMPKEMTPKEKLAANNKPSLKEMIQSKNKSSNLSIAKIEETPEVEKPEVKEQKTTPAPAVKQENKQTLPVKKQEQVVAQINAPETKKPAVAKQEKKPVAETPKTTKTYGSKLVLKEDKYIEAVQPKEPLRMATAYKKLEKKTSGKGRYIITFPEGFTLDLPLQTYLIEKKGDRYELCLRDDAKKNIDLEVLVTDYNVQDYLKANNYFIVSKNRNFTLYGLFRNNFTTGKSEILGFRLFNTVAVDKNTYVTVQSPLLESEDMKKYYINDIISLRKDNQSSRYNYEKYNSDVHKSVLSDNQPNKETEKNSDI